MKSVQQENEPRRVGSILYFSQKSCQKVIFFHFLSYPFYYVVTTLVHHGTTGLARSLITHCFYLQIFSDHFTKQTLFWKAFRIDFLRSRSPLCLHCVSIVSSYPGWKHNELAETWNLKLEIHQNAFYCGLFMLLSFCNTPMNKDFFDISLWQGLSKRSDT